MATSWPKKRRLIGTKVSRIDGPAKSTGRAKYSYDINRPGMLHAVIVRSPYAHATIKSLDTVAASKMPGVKAVYLFSTAYEGVVSKVDAQSVTVLSRPVNTAATFVKSDGNKVVITVRQGTNDVETTIEVGSDTRLLKNNAVVKAADLKAGDKIVVRKFTEKIVPLDPGTRLFKDGRAATGGEFKIDDKIVVEADKDAIGRELWYAGDEIAAICADTEEHALDAARAIHVEYNPLDHIVTEEDALK